MATEARTAAAPWAQERAELEAVLASEAFRRATRLNQLLRYICEETFEGRSDALKEYSIAVEALGRPDDFDHTRDAIVRVEAHRLRKRLRRFYAGEGEGRPFRIEVPPGGYVPVFSPAEVAAAETVAVEPTSSSRRWPWFAAAALVATFAAGDLIFDGGARSEAPPKAPVGDRAVRFSAGHPRWGAVDNYGRRWLGDIYAKGGRVVNSPDVDVARSWYAAIHSWQRRGEFRYDIPLDPGLYEVALYYAALEEGERNLFNVYGNGESWLEAFDVLADAGGPRIQTVRKFSGVGPASDGHLHLDFQPLRGDALLSAIEITPTADSKPRPIRLLAGRSAHMHDEDGDFWSADRYFEGGSVVLRNKGVISKASPNVFGGERYGDFRYVIPVAQGRYRLRLHFAETWFGETNAGMGGDGSRKFDVDINGKTVLEDMDVHAAAGGENKAILHEFRDVRPNAHSQIDLEFHSQPDHNFAMVNAIEVLPDSDGAGQRKKP